MGIACDHLVKGSVVFDRIRACFCLNRYFKYELLPKGAISKEDLPIFLSSWVDRSNASCMFLALQQRTWSSSHLTAGAWYLDCMPSSIPAFEIELKKSREAVGESGVEMIDLIGIEDEVERAKALKRRIEEDRKKAQKVKEAEEKAEQKELERQQKALQKTSKKGKRKRTPGEKDGKGPATQSPTFDSGSQAQTYSTRGTKRDSSYELLTQVPILDLAEGGECSINEWIVNRSLFDVLGGDTPSLAPEFDKLKSFMLKVLCYNLL